MSKINFMAANEYRLEDLSKFHLIVSFSVLTMFYLSIRGEISLANWGSRLYSSAMLLTYYTTC